MLRMFDPVQRFRAITWPLFIRRRGCERIGSAASQPGVGQNRAVPGAPSDRRRRVRTFIPIHRKGFHGFP
jgi:hypothetical protein